jgi:uncharacterized membrane protein
MRTRSGSILVLSVFLAGPVLQSGAWAAKPAADKSEAARVRLAIAARKTGVLPHRLALPASNSGNEKSAASAKPAKGLRLGTRLAMFTRKAQQSIPEVPKLALPNLGWRRLGVAPTSFADRLADKVTDLNGTWGFILSSGAAIGGWIAYNSVTGHAPDPDLFKLNVAISVGTFLQGGLVMLSQKRAAVKDRAAAQRDLEADLHTEQMVSELHSEVRELKALIIARDQAAAAKTE